MKYLLIIFALFVGNVFSEYEFDKSKIIDNLDYPKFLINKLFFCQSETNLDKHLTYKIDLFDETITIISTGDRPVPKATIVHAITNIKETDSFVSFDEVHIGKEKFNRWQLDKKGLSTTYQWWFGIESELMTGEPKWVQGSVYKCEKKLPDRLKPYS